MIEVTQNRIRKPRIQLLENLRKQKAVGYMELSELNRKFQVKCVIIRKN